VLFRIDPKPYEYVAEQKKAALAEAEQNVRQLKALLDQAAAAAERANAQFALAQQNYDRQAELFQKRVIAQAIDTFTRNLETSRQSLTGARAEEERARLVLFLQYRGRQHHGRPLARRTGRCTVGSRSDRHTRAGRGIRHPGVIAARRLCRPGAAAAGNGLRTDDISGYQIPLGAAAQVAIYTEYWHHVSLLRKTLLRMRSWQNYIFLEGH